MIHNRFVNFALGLILLVSSYLMGRYYFSFDKKNMEVIERNEEQVLNRLDWNWLAPNTDVIQSQLREGKLDSFNRVLLRAATSRWRLQKIAPHSFENLLNDFRNGLWDADFTKSLISLLNTLDQRWITARQQAKMANTGPIVPDFSVSPGAGLNIRFPSKVTTADVGSLLQFQIVVPPDTRESDAIDVYWSTQHYDMSDYNCLQASFVDTKETTAGGTIWLVSVDMSSSPEWLETSTEPAYMNLRAREQVQWTLAGYRFSDSSLFPIPQDLRRL